MMNTVSAIPKIIPLTVHDITNSKVSIEPYLWMYRTWTPERRSHVRLLCTLNVCPMVWQRIPAHSRALTTKHDQNQNTNRHAETIKAYLTASSKHIHLYRFQCGYQSGLKSLHWTPLILLVPGHFSQWLIHWMSLPAGKILELQVLTFKCLLYVDGFFRACLEVWYLTFRLTESHGTFRRYLNIDQ